VYSLVVVAWECAPHIERLVASMNEHLDGTQELVLVDNASSDDPDAAGRMWKGRYSFMGLGQNIGFGAGTNAGVRRAGADVVVMINPDCELLDHGLDRLAVAARELGALVGPRVLNPDGTIQASASGEEVGFWPWVRALVPGVVAPAAVRRHTEPYRLDHRVQVAWLTGSCVAGRREDLLRLGPFDEGLHMYGEDLDLGLRAAQAGIPSWFCPEYARVVHLGAGSSIQAYGSRDGWRAEGAVHWRSVLRRSYGPVAERRAWWALRANLELRLAAKRLLGRAGVRDVAAARAAASARSAPDLLPAVIPARPEEPGDPERQGDE